jgi:hypothetical protein
MKNKISYFHSLVVLHTLEHRRTGRIKCTVPVHGVPLNYESKNFLFLQSPSPANMADTVNSNSPSLSGPDAYCDKCKY